MSTLEDTPVPPPSRIALALSGGGSRAMAFHLGCLRGLYHAGLLDQVSVISSVSGGSVLAAIYCSEPGDFDDFEKRVRETLKVGFVKPALYTAITTTEGVKAVAIAIVLGGDRLAAFVVGQVLKRLRVPSRERLCWLNEASLRRSASRTTILQRTLSRLFQHKRLTDLRSDRPSLIIVACELRAKAAFYFTAKRIHCWRYGSSDASETEIAEAVVASASYPAALPALDQYRSFVKDGKTTEEHVILTDGGVYDNLGLAPFWPDRNPNISLEVAKFDRIIACRAGYSLDIAAPAYFFPSRMSAAFDSVFARAQNLATIRLFDLRKYGQLEGVLLPYLGEDDSRLKYPPSNLVTKEEVSGYPTDFSSMKLEWVDRLSRRGEQLVQALLTEHWS